MDLQKSLYDWICFISSVNSGPACPFAMKAWINKEVKLVEDRTNVHDLIPLDENISICIVPHLGISYDELSNLCDNYNLEYNEYLFLNSHPEETLTLRGKKTVWEYPAILIQRKLELEEARKTLSKIGFYKNWDLDFLDSLGISDAVE